MPNANMPMKKIASRASTTMSKIFEIAYSEDCVEIENTEYDFA